MTISPILNHFPVYRDRHKPVRLSILKLHYLMTGACQLPPAAGLRGVLFYCWVFPTAHREAHSLQVLPARASNARSGIAAHQFHGYGSQQISIPRLFLTCGVGQSRSIFAMMRSAVAIALAMQASTAGDGLPSH